MIQIVHMKECLYTTSTKYVLGMSRVKTQPEGSLVNVTQPKNLYLIVAKYNAPKAKHSSKVSYRYNPGKNYWPSHTDCLSMVAGFHIIMIFFNSV